MTDFGFNAQSPKWSPDGKQIVYLQWGFIGMRDRIVVATLDMDRLNVVTEEEVPVPQCW